MFIFKAAVVGAGTMGGQIAQTIAASGIPVLLKDIKQEFIDAGIKAATDATQGEVARLVKKGKLTEEQAQARVDEVIGRITGTLTYDGFGDVDFVIEAVPERMDIKQAIFQDLDAVTPSHAILATNTSALSVTEIGEATTRPDKVVGFHYFYPATLMPLVEVIEGEYTSAETVAVAYAFAQNTRKQPIICGECPGFVVNRILIASVGEIWKAQEEGGLDIQKVDAGLQEAKALPMGPFLLLNLLGLDTALHTAQHLHEEYDGGLVNPDTDASFYVHKGITELVAAGKSGVKTGEGVYTADGSKNLPGDNEPNIEELVQRTLLTSLREACQLVEEGIAGIRDIDFGMMGGAGMDPRRGLLPPFMKADQIGLDVILSQFVELEEKFGARFAPPVLLQRLVAQGRLGTKTGQGFYPYPNADAEQPAETVKLESREGGVSIAWLANGMMNSLSPAVIGDLRKVWETVKSRGDRALVIASSNPLLFCAGADIKAFTQLDEAAGAQLLSDAHGLFREIGQSDVATIAAVNGLAFGGGNELAMACDVRLAARSAVFGQPEIKLGIIPGFGGTQRLPRLVGAGRALELNLVGDPLPAALAEEYGLVNRVVDDHALLETALNWARKLASQAPIAVRQIKDVSGKGDLDEGIAAEIAGFAAAFGSNDAKEGISAFLGKRAANWTNS
ncbi:MAG: 3-hydroxyacyl-CoA dehydrogenase NAD-binding domain-containing protein [Solirubrobacteraceae bacterium]|nr:3-hydroxyacyl-CoA dehydrogenase NAD-binding domain-containing protein [Patulibacter sp.]